MKIDALKEHLATILASNRERFEKGEADYRDVLAGIRLLAFIERSALIEEADQDYVALLKKECARRGISFPGQVKPEPNTKN